MFFSDQASITALAPSSHLAREICEGAPRQYGCLRTAKIDDDVVNRHPEKTVNQSV
jgi:hypothetical protein